MENLLSTSKKLMKGSVCLNDVDFKGAVWLLF